MPQRSLKVVVLSASSGGDGATQLMNVYMGLPFEAGQRQRTTSADFQVKKVPVVFEFDTAHEHDGIVALTIIDTCATTAERWLVSRGAHAAVIVFDVTSRESFENVPAVFNEFRKAAGTGAAVILVANKIDRRADDGRVSAEEAKALAKELGGDVRGGAYLMEASAKTDKTTVDAVFDEAIARGFELQGTSVAVIEPPQDENNKAPVIAEAPKDLFAPQLLKRDLDVAPLHPPVLVPQFQPGKEPSAAEKQKKDDSSNDDDQDGEEEEEAVTKPDVAAAECRNVLAQVGDIFFDAQEMLKLLKQHKISFEGKVFSTSV